MFQAKLTEGALFKKLIDIIKDLVTDVNFDISETGISLQALDSSHVSLVSLNLSAEGFEEYRCDKSMTLGVSIANLSKIMKCGTNDESITLSTEEEEPSSLNIKFESLKKKSESTFKLSLISIESEHLGISDAKYSSQVTMSSNEFTRIVRELCSLNETVNIETNENSIKFNINSDTIGGCIKKDANDSSVIDEACIIEVDEPVNLDFGLRYLNMFSKASSLCQQVSLFLSSKFPLKVEYKLENLGVLKFYLAPKISEENNK